MSWILESVDGDFEPCTIDEWLESNREGLDPEEALAICCLVPGQTYSGGGGAGASWTVRRARPVVTSCG